MFDRFKEIFTYHYLNVCHRFHRMLSNWIYLSQIMAGCSLIIFRSLNNRYQRHVSCHWKLHRELFCQLINSSIITTTSNVCKVHLYRIWYILETQLFKVLHLNAWCKKNHWKFNQVGIRYWYYVLITRT